MLDLVVVHWSFLTFFLRLIVIGGISFSAPSSVVVVIICRLFFFFFFGPKLNAKLSLVWTIYNSE